MIDWNSYPKQVLVWMIQDYQLPVASAPSRQYKATLVEALERYEKQRLLNPRSAKDTIAQATYKHKLAQLLQEYRSKGKK